MRPYLSLQGRIDPGASRRVEGREWLARAALWFEAAGDAVLATQPLVDSLRVSLHPAAADLEIRLSPVGIVHAAASTGPAGPGYHAYLSAALDLFAADFDIHWERAEDTTGFRVAGCADGLTNHFLDDLRTTCRSLPRAGPVSLGLPVDHGYTHPGPVLTPLGPRSRSWLSGVIADPELGVDVFPWWTPELDATYFRNRALTALWCEFPWRAPLWEYDGELLDQIAADLDLAHALDPAGPIPWRAWAGVVAALDGDCLGYAVQQVDPRLRGLIARNAAGSPLDEIGYRRYPVRLAVGGGWTVEVPGSFADGWEEDGQTWVSWDAHRRVTVRPGHSAGTPSSRQCRNESGRRVWRLDVGLATDGEPLTCQVDAIDPTDRDWAAGVIRSLRHVTPGTSSVA